MAGVAHDMKGVPAPSAHDADLLYIDYEILVLDGALAKISYEIEKPTGWLASLGFF